MSDNDKKSGAHGVVGAIKQLVVHPAAKSATVPAAPPPATSKNSFRLSRLAPGSCFTTPPLNLIPRPCRRLAAVIAGAAAKVAAGGDG